MRVEYGRDAVTISLNGANWEAWYVVRRDGVVTYHRENNGWRFRRRGPESQDETLTRERLYAGFSGDTLLEVYRAIATLDHPQYHAHFCLYDPPRIGHWYPCIQANCSQAEQAMCMKHLREKWERDAKERAAKVSR